MLSFVYIWLPNQVAPALENVGLDPYVGMFHMERSDRVSLALDLIEELRPVLADRFVLSMINKNSATRRFPKKRKWGCSDEG